MIELSDTLQADYFSCIGLFSGQIYHVQKNGVTNGVQFGAISTPIARFFADRPTYIENCHEHWSLHCFFRVHELCPEPMQAGDLLVKALIQQGIRFDPIFLTVYSSQELEGRAYGEVYDFS